MGAQAIASAVACELLLVAIGCGFSTPGGGKATAAQLGDDDDDGSGDDGSAAGTDGDTGGSTAGAGGDATSAAGSVSDPGSSGGGDGTTQVGDDAMDATTDGAVDPCAAPPQFVQMIPVSMAVIGPPMVTAPHTSYGSYAYSTATASGSASFTFTADCSDTFWVWALVYDAQPGSVFGVGGNPDSYFVRIDTESDRLFTYGCYAWGEPVWSWQTLQDTVTCFDDERIEFTVAPGNHTIHFTNVEGGSAQAGDDPGGVAAIAGIVVTNDPSYQP